MYKKCFSIVLCLLCYIVLFSNGNSCPNKEGCKKNKRKNMIKNTLGISGDTLDNVWANMQKMFEEKNVLRQSLKEDKATIEQVLDMRKKILNIDEKYYTQILNQYLTEKQILELMRMKRHRAKKCFKKNTKCSSKSREKCSKK